MAGYLCMSTAPPVYHVTSHLFYLWNTIFLIHVIFFLFFFLNFFSYIGGPSTCLSLSLICQAVFIFIWFYQI